MGISICVGVDPNLNILSGFLKEQLSDLGRKVFLSKYGKTLVDVADYHNAHIKFQSAYFEAQGATGIEVLKELSFYAKTKRVPVILDAKRSDIGSTMAAYFSFAFEYLNIDSMTVVPYMGLDNILKEHQNYPSKKLFVVGLSSNPSGIQFQSMKLSSGDSIFENIIDAVISKKSKHSLGIVIGGTEFNKVGPERLKLLQGVSILVPGFGAQNAKFPASLKEHSANLDVLASSSRGLSLTGMGEEKLASWDDFADVVSLRSKKFNDNMWENCH